MQCVDAETLAAWADGGLPKREAAAVELHLADCERCTAMLATFVRTTPELPAAESLWHRWHLRWLVPMATAATVAALWVLIPDSSSRLAQTSDSTVATRELETPPSAPSSVVEAPKKEAANAGTQAAPAEQKRADAKALAPLEREQRQTRDEVRQEPQATFAPAVPSSPPAPAPARESDLADQRAGNIQQERAAAAPPTAAPAAAPPTTAQAPSADASRAEAQRAEAPRTRALSAASARGFATLLEIVSPDRMTRWRVVGTGQVERSTNGGARWEPATLPESATLTGGSSPSPTICWLVGRTGAIYVTTDGLRFNKVPFQDRTDFVSIQAQDGRRATVVTIDGRTFRTEDQGAIWIRITP